MGLPIRSTLDSGDGAALLARFQPHQLHAALGDAVECEARARGVVPPDPYRSNTASLRHDLPVPHRAARRRSCVCSGGKTAPGKYVVDVEVP